MQRASPAPHAGPASAAPSSSSDQHGAPRELRLFQIPIAEEFGWLRSEFSLAIAIQNLAWGIGQPIFGAIAERFGDRRAIMLGTHDLRRGLVLSAFADHAAGSTRPRTSSWASASPGRGLASSSPSSAARRRTSNARSRWASPPRPARRADRRPDPCRKPPRSDATWQRSCSSSSLASSWRASCFCRFCAAPAHRPAPSLKESLRRPSARPSATRPTP
jgi:hypothetical protein